MADKTWTLNTLINPDTFEPSRVKTAQNIFEYTQFLLDDDDNLTKTGNLTKTAKEALHARVSDLLGVTITSEKDE